MYEFVRKDDFCIIMKESGNTPEREHIPKENKRRKFLGVIIDKSIIMGICTGEIFLYITRKVV